MSHYAKVVDGKVVNVIVAEEDFFKTFIDTTPGHWIQTSYNTHGNVNSRGAPALRGNFAAIGYTYDSVHDVFYPPQPASGWTISAETNWLWVPPAS